MDLLTLPICLSHYLIVGAVLFVCGVVCMTIKRNAVGVLMGVELVLNGANLNFVAFSSPLLEEPFCGAKFLRRSNGPEGVRGGVPPTRTGRDPRCGLQPSWARRGLFVGFRTVLY